MCLSVDLPADKIKELVAYLESEVVAYDMSVQMHRLCWCGATVEKSDLEALVP